MKLDLNDLYVTSFSMDSGEPVEPGDDTAYCDDTTDAARTHPRQCADSRYLWCITYQAGCQSGGGAVC
jgi:hypothetical protein